MAKTKKKPKTNPALKHCGRAARHAGEAMIALADENQDKAKREVAQAFRCIADAVQVTSFKPATKSQKAAVKKIAQATGCDCPAICTEIAVTQQTLAALVALANFCGCSC